MRKASFLLLKSLLLFLIPLVIVFGSLRLVATKTYLSLEYSKTDFPEDILGFDRAQRLAHANANLQFVTQDQPLANLIGEKHDDDPLYNSLELRKMEKVQTIYQAAWRIWQIALLLAALSVFLLAWRKETRADLAAAFQVSGALTAGLAFAGGMFALVAWEAWNVSFHQIFFAAGSWTFDISAILIRLFPEKLWYDATLTVASLSLIAGILVYWVGSRLSIINSGQPDRNEPTWQGQINTSRL